MPASKRPAYIRPIAVPLERPHWWRSRPSAAMTSWGFGVLFVAAALLTALPYWPALRYSVATPTISPNKQIAEAAPAQSASVNTVIIPKIGVRTAILEGPTLGILNRQEGVWHQTGVFDKSNFVLAGHRFKYLPPNTSTLYNLDKLSPGDVIIVDWHGRRTVFTIATMATVPATDVAVAAPSSIPRLTIYTCNEKSQTHRVVATATPLP